MHFALLTLLVGAAAPILGLFLGFWILPCIPDRAVGLSLVFAGVALILGSSQGALLVPRLTQWRLWLPATVVGGTGSLWLFGYSASRVEAQAPALGMAALSGAVLGLCQALALRPARRALLVWVPGTMLAVLGARTAHLPVGHDLGPILYLCGPALSLALGQTLGLALLLAASRAAADARRGDAA